jgi:peptidoglycan L-alanyl-D-glutamate endopeptidase CwlK
MKLKPGVFWIRDSNRKPDTRRVQQALNRIFPATPLVVDGDCGRKTIARIERFQRDFLPGSDGCIDPAGRSLRLLNQMLIARPIKRAATKKAATKKAATKKAATKKAATKKAATKKAATKKAATKKAATKKAATKKAATKKAATKKAATKKAATKKATTAAAAAKAVKSSTQSASAGITISASVGRDGDNRKADTRKIQKALNQAIPKSPLIVDGDCGAKTIKRIERFQSAYMRRPDGRIDPGGRSLRRLNQAAPSLQSEWKGDSSRWSQEKKLDSLDNALRKKVVRILARLEAEGFRPKIVYAWRSVAVQQQLVAQGRSRVRFSFHNAQYKSGRPRAHAIDVIDRRWAWDDAAERNGFWDALGRAGKDEDLFWGGDWRSFRDLAHLQSFPNAKLTEIKRQSGVA